MSNVGQTGKFCGREIVLLDVTCNDILVIYVTAHGCTGGLKK